MSFNPMMALVTRGLVDLLEDNPTVIELGNQTFNADNRALDKVLLRSESEPRVDLTALNALRNAAPDKRQAATGDYYRALGFAQYDAIDINDRYGSLVMDLNQRLKDTYDFKNTYSLVTNSGTGEHVFNQLTILQNVHDLSRTGGLMLHVLPFIGYINHGFYSFHPNLYYAVAKANDYELLGLGIATRSGLGFVAQPAGAENKLPSLLMDDRTVPMELILAGSKSPRSGLVGHLTARLKPQDLGRRFHTEMRKLQRDKFNLLSFALMRKRSQAEFRIPLQIRYEDSIRGDDLRETYLGNG